MIIIDHGWSNSIIFSNLVDPLPNIRFLCSLSIHHACDVIKMGLKEAYQKTKTDLLLKLVKYFWFLNWNSSNWCKNECFVCNQFFKKLSDSQEIDHKFKSFIWPFTGSVSEKVSKSFSDCSLHYWGCFVYHFILFIISVITWLSLTLSNLILSIKIIKMGSKSRNKKNKKALGAHLKRMSKGNGP